jgi:hypothetical protein
MFGQGRLPCLAQCRPSLGDPVAADLAGLVVEPPDGGNLEQRQLPFHGSQYARAV